MLLLCVLDSVGLLRARQTVQTPLGQPGLASGGLFYELENLHTRSDIIDELL